MMNYNTINIQNNYLLKIKSTELSIMKQVWPMHDDIYVHVNVVLGRNEKGHINYIISTFY